MSDTPRTDAILALLPGGQTCDPQLVADELRPKIAEMEADLAAAKDGWTDEICKAQADMRRAEKDINELRAAYLVERALADRLAELARKVHEISNGNFYANEAPDKFDDICDISHEALAAWEGARK